MDLWRGRFENSHKNAKLKFKKLKVKGADKPKGNLYVEKSRRPRIDPGGTP